MQFKSFMEALKGKQHKIDKNKNGQIDAHDFKLLRKEESEETIEESEERMARADYKVGPSGRKSHKEIVFKDAESKDDEDKKEMKEAKMSDDDMAERERIVKGMKKNLAGFKARYGDRAKEVMYATATKQAMKEETVEEAVQKADIPAYLRKQQGQTPLTLKDLKRKDTISDKENLAKLRNEEKKDDVPFEGPYTKTKPAKNSDGTTQSPMSRARQLAKDAMKKQMKEDIDRLFEKDDTEYDYEGEMAVTQLKTIIRHAEALQAKLQPDTNLPEWVQSKITLATDYIQTASDYLHSELEEQAPVAPVPDKKYIKGTPEHKAYKATKKPINGMPTNVKEETELDEVESKILSYGDFISNLLEYETKGGRYVHKGTYGGSYTDPEGADDADDKKPKQQPAEKRGRGRPAGAKSGAGKITGTSKLYK
jgi:hypothetical protein